MARQYKVDDEVAMIKKINYYFWIAVEKQNFNILRKIEQKVEVPTTIITSTT